MVGAWFFFSRANSCTGDTFTNTSNDPFPINHEVSGGGGGGVRKIRGGFGKVLYSAAIVAKLCEPSDEEIRKQMKGSREKTAEKTENRKRTATPAPSEPAYGQTSR